MYDALALRVQIEAPLATAMYARTALLMGDIGHEVVVDVVTGTTIGLKALFGQQLRNYRLRGLRRGNWPQ